MPWEFFRSWIQQDLDPAVLLVLDPAVLHSLRILRYIRIFPGYVTCCWFLDDEMFLIVTFYFPSSPSSHTTHERVGFALFSAGPFLGNNAPIKGEEEVSSLLPLPVGAFVFIAHRVRYRFLLQQYCSSIYTASSSRYSFAFQLFVSTDRCTYNTRYQVQKYTRCTTSQSASGNNDG